MTAYETPTYHKTYETLESDFFFQGRCHRRPWGVHVGVSVRYIVDDVDRAIEFYGRLGFELDMRPAPGFARLRRAGLILLLNAPGAGGAGRAGGEPRPGGWNRFQIQPDDLDRLVADLGAAGASFRGNLIEGRGGRQILVEDPSGNVVELFEPASG